MKSPKRKSSRKRGFLKSVTKHADTSYERQLTDGKEGAYEI